MDARTARPAAALPEACAPRADQASRFRDNPQVTPANRRAAHSADTVARGAAADGPVLRAWDTTGLDFRTPPHPRGLGDQQPLQQHGLFVHATRACSADGVPLGWLDQRAWARDPADCGQRRPRRHPETAAQESGRWLEARTACAARRPAGTAAVFLADRAGDLLDRFAAARPAGRDVLSRADGRRRLLGEERLLGAVLAAASVYLATRTVDMPRRDGPPGRPARVAVRVQRVTLAVPSTHPRKSSCVSVEVTAPPGDGGRPAGGRGGAVVVAADDANGDGRRDGVARGGVLRRALAGGAIALHAAERRRRAAAVGGAGTAGACRGGVPRGGRAPAAADGPGASGAGGAL